MTKKRLIIIAALAALAALLAIPAVVMGDATDTTTVTGQIGTYYTIDAPDNFSMTITASTGGNSGNKTLTAKTNDDTKTSVSISVKEADGDGKLSNGSNVLSSALQLSGSGLNTVTLSGTDQPLIQNGSLTGTPKTWSVTDLVIAQPAFNEVPAGNYNATITFTATFN